MAYIQILPVDGTGEKIYPDAAMDAGTRGLIDTIDPWSWGGTTPAQGAALAKPLEAAGEEGGRIALAIRTRQVHALHMRPPLRIGQALHAPVYAVLAHP